MKEYRIPVCWMMYGFEDVRANSLEEAIEIAENAPGLPYGEYIDGSFEVDVDAIDEHNE